MESIKIKFSHFAIDLEYFSGQGLGFFPEQDLKYFPAQNLEQLIRKSNDPFLSSHRSVPELI